MIDDEAKDELIEQTVLEDLKSWVTLDKQPEALEPAMAEDPVDPEPEPKPDPADRYDGELWCSGQFDEADTELRQTAEDIIRGSRITYYTICKELGLVSQWRQSDPLPDDVVRKLIDALES